MPSFLFSLLFVALYIGLDAVSFIHPLYGLNITPWNPAPALGLAFLLRRGEAGRRFGAWAWLVLAVLGGELLVRGLPAAAGPAVLATLLLAGGYIALGEALRRRLPATSLLDDRSALLDWAATVALGSLSISLLYLAALFAGGLLPAAGWWSGVLRFWVGDAVGIVVLMPLLWWLSSERGRFLLAGIALRWETAGYLLLALVTLVATFAWGDGDGFKRFYLLFLPLIWAAARQGMVGAVLCAGVLQLGLIVAVLHWGYNAGAITDLQWLSLAMALVAFFIGVVVDEQRRTSGELRQSLRLAAAGEMAGALAHELNQPLTALAAYAAACETLLARGEGGERLHNAIQGMLQASARTGEVVRRLRDFFRTGATRLETVALPDLLAAAVASYQGRASEAGIALTLGEVPPVTLWADRLQLEVVLRNLLANACEAAADGTPPAAGRRVWLAVERLAGGRVGIVVEDSGPGLSVATGAHLFEPFQSSKSSGMGLGLAISRAIVDTHGGSLWGEVAGHGVFRLQLPCQEEPHE
jgi:signal transduction histidine kinase